MLSTEKKIVSYSISSSTFYLFFSFTFDFFFRVRMEFDWISLIKYKSMAQSILLCDNTREITYTQSDTVRTCDWFISWLMILIEKHTTIDERKFTQKHSLDWLHRCTTIVLTLPEEIPIWNFPLHVELGGSCIVDIKREKRVSWIDRVP